MTAAPAVLASALRRWAADTPDRLAVVDVGTSMSFAELDTAASAVAAELHRDVTPDGDPPWLPVLVDRSVGSVVALCAAIRAGRPYSPIAADLPAARIEELLQRLGEPDTVLVAQERFGDALPPGRRVVAVDRSLNSMGGVTRGVSSDVATEATVQRDAVAMAVFTSGSTGHPKCVLRSWSMLDRAIDDQIAVGVPAHVDEWRWGAVQPFTFGGSRALAVLALGGSLMVIDPAAHDAELLLDRLHEWRVDECNLVPTLARSLVAAAAGARRLPHLRRVLLGGEPVDWDLVAPLRSLVASDAQILHEYGNSEAGRVFAYEVPRDDAPATGRLPLGRPVERRTIRLEQLDGVEGSRHLVVADPDSFAYLGDDELTAERFSVDADGTRWYATGDLFSTDPDGFHHHAGRLDDMVKINGMLVEPSEAEVALRSLPGVADAIVLPQRSESGVVSLVAHLVVDDEALTPAAVRRALEGRLPRHLVPGVLVRHDRLPMSDRLKVDRVALTSAATVRWRSTPVRPPVDDAERWVLGVVRSVLGDDDVHPDDDVWSVGLDSLGAVELCARLADAGVIELEPTALLDLRTPAAIAGAAVTGVVRRGSPVVAFHPGGSRPPIVVVPGSGGTALAFAAVAHDLGVDQPVLVVEPRGLHTRGVPHLRVRPMAGHVLHHLAPEVTARPFVLVGYSGGAAVAHEVAAMLHDHGAAPALVLLDPAVGGTAPATGRPLTRLDLRRVVRMGMETVLLVGDAIVGRVRTGPERYRWFHRVHAATARRHRLRRVPLSATVVRSRDGELAAFEVPGATDVFDVVVGGGHHSMLEPPHSAEAAAALRAVVDRLG